MRVVASLSRRQLRNQGSSPRFLARVLITPNGGAFTRHRALSRRSVAPLRAGSVTAHPFPCRRHVRGWSVTSLRKFCRKCTRSVLPSAGRMQGVFRLSDFSDMNPCNISVEQTCSSVGTNRSRRCNRNLHRAAIDHGVWELWGEVRKKMGSL